MKPFVMHTDSWSVCAPVYGRRQWSYANQTQCPVCLHLSIHQLWRIIDPNQTQLPVYLHLLFHHSYGGLLIQTGLNSLDVSICHFSTAMVDYWSRTPFQLLKPAACVFMAFMNLTLWLLHGAINSWETVLFLEKKSMFYGSRPKCLN